MFKITEEWLKEQGACEEGLNWFLNQKEVYLDNCIKALLKVSKFNWANWVLIRIFSHRQNVIYACFSAKLSLKYFEKQFPKDKRPRLAIKAALKWAKHPTEENKLAAGSAAGVAWSVARSVALAAGSAAWLAAESAALAAGSAALAAGSAALAAGSAAGVAALAAESAALAAGSAAESAAWKKILMYGLKLLNEA